MKKKSSFGLRIIVMLTIIIVSTSSISFYLFNNYLNKKIYKKAEENVVSILHLLKDQYYHIKHDEENRLFFLKKMKEHNWVNNIYIANSEGDIVYPNEYKSYNHNSLNSGNILSLNKEVTVEEYNAGNDPYTRIYLKMENTPSCYRCHDSKVNTIGYLVYDISLKEAAKSKTSILWFSLIFTLFMVLIIVIVVIIMHYKFVKKSLTHFKSKIGKINKGNLNERIIIPESKELGQLGKDFNEMVENFQNTQNELLLFHKKELKYSKKLATVGEMAARLAHEIRNPITGIANAIEVIVDQTHDEENKSILEEIKRQANRVNDVVSNLLIFSRSKDLNTQENNINKTIESLVFFMKNQNHHKKVDFQLQLQSDIPNFSFDKEKIENALLNIALNAVQSIKHSGTVIFKTAYNSLQKQVTISIEDTGDGIPQNMFSKIFSPFYTTRTEGTGLGLAIVKDVIEKHQGEIWVEANIDTGSIFFIKLPMKEKSVFSDIEE